MSRDNQKRTPTQNTEPTSATGERRRIGKVVHDERGSATLEWHDAPEDYERPVLEIEEPEIGERSSKVRRGLEVLSIRTEDNFNPYNRTPEPSAGTGRSAGGGKRDLRKLSAWIKMMRELEDRKKNGGEDA